MSVRTVAGHRRTNRAVRRPWRVLSILKVLARVMHGVAIATRGWEPFEKEMARGLAEAKARGASSVATVEATTMPTIALKREAKTRAKARVLALAGFYDMSFGGLCSASVVPTAGMPTAKFRRHSSASPTSAWRTLVLSPRRMECTR